MAILVSSSDLLGIEFAEGIFETVLLEKEKTGQDRLEIKKVEFDEQTDFSLKTEDNSLSWLMPLSDDLIYNGFELTRQSLLILPPRTSVNFKGNKGEKFVLFSVFKINRFLKDDENLPSEIKCVDWSAEPVLLSEFDSRKRIYLASPVLWDGLSCVKGEMIYYPKGGTAPPHHHTGAEHFQYVIEGSGTAFINGTSEIVREGDIIYSFEDERHWFENHISDNFVFAEFFVPGSYQTIWDNPEKVCTWLPTGKDISGRPAARSIAKHVAGQGKDV